MTSLVRPSTPEDEPAIVALMSDAGLPPPAHPQYLYWKYWQPCADWPRSRSYVLTDASGLLAHVAVIPSSCGSQSGRVRMASMVDWAARPSQVGAGVRVMKHVAGLMDALLAIGGSPAARKVMPLMGYRAHGLVTAFARPLSPLKLLRVAADSGWKRWPRFARSLFWKLSAPAPATHHWRCRPITGAEAHAIEPILSASRPGLAVMERSVAQLRHMFDCPIAPVRLYAVEDKRSMRGYFMLAFVRGQARLIDAGVAAENSDHWQALIECAAQEASRGGLAAELVAWASDSLFSGALARTGFHPRFNLPVLLRPGSQGGPSEDPLRVQMLDSDAAYLHDDHGALWA
jgi:hypothetical protein